MRVDRRDHIFDGRLQAHRERRLGDQLARLRADDVYADDPLVLARRDDLRESVRLAERERATGAPEVVARGLHVRAVFLFRLGLSEPNLRDLRMCVNDVRRDVVVHRCVLAEDGVDRDLALRRRDVRELRRARIADAVTDRPHARDVRAHAVIDGDAEAVRGEASLLDTRKVRDPAGPEEDVLALERLLLPVDLGVHRHDGPGALHLGDLRVHSNLDTALLERAHEETHELGIGIRDRLRQHLEDGHIAPDLRKEGAELETDRTAADNDETLRGLREREGAHVVERLRLRQSLDRRRPHLRARRNDQRLRVDGLAADPKLRRRHESPFAFDEIGLSTFQERLDPGDELSDDPILTRDRLRELEARAIDVDPVVLTVRREPVGMARVEECLRGYASDRHTDAADAIALDEGDLCALHGGVQGRDVSARAAAKYRDVVRGHYEKSLGSSDASRSNGCSKYPYLTRYHR